MAGEYSPTGELVAVAWMRQRVPGIDPAQVSTVLPEKPETWPLGPDGGFITLAVLAGRGPDIDTPVLRHPVFQVDFWAAPKTLGGKPPWGAANKLAEAVFDAMDLQLYGRPVTLPAQYRGARVQGAYFVTEPSRVTGDPSGYARYTADLALDWVKLAA